MRQRIIPDWVPSGMSTCTLLGVLLAVFIPSGCGASGLDRAMCAINIQKQCREPNDRLTEMTGVFHSSRDNTVMCQYYLLTLKCVAQRVPDCHDWFYSTSIYYSQSPYDCKVTKEAVMEIQNIMESHKNKDVKVDEADNPGSTTSQPANNGVTTAPFNSSASEGDSPGGGSSTKSPDEGGKGNGYTVENTANAHGNKDKQTGDSSTCLTLNILLLAFTAVGPSLLSQVFTL